MKKSNGMLWKLGDINDIPTTFHTGIFYDITHRKTYHYRFYNDIECRTEASCGTYFVRFASLALIINSMLMLELKERLKICDLIKENLEKTMRENILSATVYGSTLTEDFCDVSDFDILIVLKDTSIVQLMKLREIKKEFYDKGINIDFNVHSESDMPKTRKKLYRHNNRAYFFQKEIQIYGKQLIGENPYESKFEQNDIIDEAIKVINSINYQARKMLINRELTEEEKIRMMKFTIYAVLYALGSKNIYINSKKEALNEFKKHFPIDPEPIIFLLEKTNNYKNISNETINIAYSFISKLDKYIYNLYKGENAK